jgi:predicted RNA-binding protein YlqC (UPF0109 family)|nr:MAG: UPF0109 protein [Bacteroidota bacterium]
MREFVAYIVQHLVDHPAAVEVTDERAEDGRVLYRLRVDPRDVGKVIGKAGKTAQALRVLLVAAAARRGQRARLVIVEERSDQSEHA